MARSFSTAHRLATFALAAALSSTLSAQAPRLPVEPSPPAAASAADASAQPSDETATLVFFNRQIVSMRARVLGRRPIERAIAAVRALDDLAAQRITEPVELRAFNGGLLVQVGSRTVFALTSPDIDELSGDGAYANPGLAAEMRRAQDAMAAARGESA